MPPCRQGRDPSEITLVAATKMNDAERVQAAIEAGIRVCGENRVQELQEKYEQNAYDGRRPSVYRHAADQ